MRTAWIVPAVFGTLGLALCGAGGLLVWGFLRPKTTEVRRVSNPSRTVDAVVLADDYDQGGFGRSREFRVLLVPHGARAEKERRNLVLGFYEAEGYGPRGDWKPEWPADDRLLLRFKSARVTRYDNEPLSVNDRSIGVNLQILAYGDKPPAGG